MPVDYNKVVELLQLGRERIETSWTQFSYRKNGEYCAVGAVRYDTGQDRYVRKASQLLLKDSLPHKWNMVEGYNDQKNRKREEVIAIYDIAIALAQEQCEGEPLAPIEEEERELVAA